MTNNITLRDHFAGLAMQAMISTDPKFELNDDCVAKGAYQIADAMLAERDKNAVDQIPPDYSDLLKHIKCEGCDE